MAREALGRHRLESTVSAVLMASIAVDGCVRTGQRESIVVLLNIFVGDLPSTDRVALFAIGAQLAAMHVGVTILTTLADVGENHFDVTLRAGNCSMHASERVPGLIVIKFWNRANGFPCARGMAVLTG